MYPMEQVVKNLSRKPITEHETAIMELARKAPQRAGASKQWDATRSYVLQRLVIATLKTVRGNQCKAARELGMHRNTLRRVLLMEDVA